jgi:hypothetical protein
MSVAKDGSNRMMLGGGTSHGNDSVHPIQVDLVIDETTVYWTQLADVSSTIRAVSKKGGPSAVLASTPDQTPHEIAIDDDRVYWIDTQTGTIWSVPKPRCCVGRSC